MTSRDEPIRISRYTQDRLIRFAQNAIGYQSQNGNLRSYFLERDRIYQREIDWTTEHLRARFANMSGQALKMQNVVMPVVMPQVEAQHGYLVDTFLSSYPLFPVVSGPDYFPVAQQIDAIMGESAVRFQYSKHFSMCFRDGLKYNIMAMEVDWKELKVYTVTTDLSKSVVQGSPVETEFSGNMVKRIDLYNAIWDKRVPISEVHIRGDYAGYVELISRIQLKNLFLELDPTLTMNADAAFESSHGVAAVGQGNAAAPYYIPEVNPAVSRDMIMPATSGEDMDWFAWLGQDTVNKIKHASSYELLTLHLRMIPRDVGINLGKQTGQNGVPQIFKVLIINGQVVIYVQHKSNAHNFLPMVFGQPIEDGLNFQTKSFADNAAPYQFLASALYNSGIASQRKKVYDRIYYDPSRINKSDIDRVDPVARIAVKTEAYGKPIGDAIYAAPYRDDGVAQILMMGREVAEMSDVSVGQNRVGRGQFQKGNKTLKEFDTVMDKSELRPRTMAITIETAWMQPIKYVLKMNILQYQTPVELFNVKTQAAVKIEPSELRKVAWQFQVADGVMPVSKLLNPELFQLTLQYAMTVPTMAAQYDLVGMAVYSLKLQGASWIDNFKLTPEQAKQNAAAIAGPQQTALGGTTNATPPATS